MTNTRLSLMYHDVIDRDAEESGFQSEGANSYKINKNKFENQIHWIAQYCKNKNADINSIAITFDDGGESAYSIAAPVLEQYKIKAYFFIATDFIGSKGFVNESQIKDLYKRGHYIGAHSHTHPKNIALLLKDAINYEWSRSIEILSDIISEKITTASIPNGFYSETSRIALEKNHIDLIFTSLPANKIAFTPEGSMILGRFVIKNNTSCRRLSQLMSGNSLRLIYEITKWQMLAASRSILGNYYYQFRDSLLKINH